MYGYHANQVSQKRSEFVEVVFSDVTESKTMFYSDMNETAMNNPTYQSDKDLSTPTYQSDKDLSTPTCQSDKDLSTPKKVIILPIFDSFSRLVWLLLCF